ncbi:MULTISPECIES: hypothetical protein [unclassified Acinetobacter]|uniref:hypothetical protein n=1 Tax=Acinetobacter TaxID=469 RepID=UPI000DCF69C4|nr:MULTISPECIES: hypothetical protein [unclassified Acinetobacter]MDM1760715.1 hypothetical protein [Acinetobacter sp. 251-1]
MAIKFFIKSKNGNALIDDTYRTLSLTSVRTIAQSNNIEIKRNSFSVLALSCQTEGVMMLGASYANGFSWKSLDHYTTKGELKIYEFSDVEVLRDPVGINIRNSLGVLVFSSKLKPLRVVHHQSGVIKDVWQDEVLYEANLDPSRKYAVVLGNLPFSLSVSRDVVYARALTITTQDNGYTKVQFKQFSYEAQTGAVRGNIAVSGFYSFQIIDVTTY